MKYAYLLTYLEGIVPCSGYLLETHLLNNQQLVSINSDEIHKAIIAISFMLWNGTQL